MSSSNELTIGFVRRGFSSGGGAENYLSRLAAGVRNAGHDAALYTSGEWPADVWNFGPVVRLNAGTAIEFADQLAKTARQPGEVRLSLERVWGCDVYRAGDGVHRAWLERRSRRSGPLKKIGRILNRKHTAALALDESLFGKRGALRVIANSRMVKEEIIRFYNYPADRIEVVYNGVPLPPRQATEEDRQQTRKSLGLHADDFVLLFAGSGWERKGLRFAVEAVQRQEKRTKLLVAGRGESRTFASTPTQFLGIVGDMPSLYQAADAFVLPTLYDPFSNACLEALAAGLPVITTQSNGFSEIIESGRHGTVVDDASNVDALNDAIQFWSEPERRKQARIDNLALAAQFDISRNVAETLRVVIAR